MSLIKTDQDIEKIREGGAILADILRRTIKLAVPGVSTWDLNAFAEKEIVKAGGRPSFKGYGPKGHEFPAGLCTSINSIIVHGMPSKKDILQQGDIVGLDIGMEYKGRYTDHAVTVAVGKISKEAQKLLDVTSKALQLAIKQARVGNKIGDIASATQLWVEKNGFNVVRNLVGHGVGYAVHEDPKVPCFGKAHTGMELKAGMVLAIEPMVTAGDYQLALDADGWGFLTLDKSLAAHFEHTVAITKKGPQILTI
jgi:methionyl aminopeptidase